MQIAPREHSAILSPFIKLPFVLKTFVLSIIEWQLKTGFTHVEDLPQKNEDFEYSSPLIAHPTKIFRPVTPNTLIYLFGPMQTVWTQIRLEGAQWLSGRVLDSRPKGCGFEPQRRHCVVVLEQDTFILA